MATKKVDEKSFGAKLQQLRLARKISFAKLSNLTGFSQRYLKEIEEGIAVPPVSALIQIAKALSVDSGSFLSADEKEASQRRRRENFFKRTQAYSYKTLTPEAEEKHMKAFLVTIDPALFPPQPTCGKIKLLKSKSFHFILRINMTQYPWH